ncbi:dienelactone hydrolase family protein [Neobacillus sp. MER 74]|uniref:alpha/beta hydrolase n=1 Tax=Neobacillus sp. MER 74 TaxID=2939566 RepID=UPI00203E9099|nr:dienelactone hydrolase family protein [Neobacillus sp. MER 74]MCM3118051.1 dienelactone hydrolase family protein [Neobacillus sp. MER 74]
MFEYKEEKLSGFAVVKTIPKDGYHINDVKYESPFKGEVSAYLFIPDQLGPLPAVIYMHPSQGDRKTFFCEAQMLATQGYITLLIEAQYLRGNKQLELRGKKEFTKTIEEMADIQKYIQTVMDIKRGVTLLRELGKVDESKIAFVGQGMGAAWGGILSGIENRIKTFILISGYGQVSEMQMTSEHPSAVLIRGFLPPERFEFFISSLKKLDAIHYVKNASPASIFFQFAENDEYIGRNHANSLYSIASSPKKISWYDTNHEFSDCEDAFYDRIEWLNVQFSGQKSKLLKESTLTKKLLLKRKSC